jgi:hypothetical protein
LAAMIQRLTASLPQIGNCVKIVDEIGVHYYLS